MEITIIKVNFTILKTIHIYNYQPTPFMSIENYKMQQLANACSIMSKLSEISHIVNSLYLPKMSLKIKIVKYLCLDSF